MKLSNYESNTCSFQFFLPFFVKLDLVSAYLNRPAIIFFDELDAVAPIRSKRQDHVHASVVSTLLTLMDGLKSPQDVVVIGATNRLDEIDPALRRPGRFDKELFFPPPDLEARRTILNIHTRHWHTDTSTEFMDRLAENTAGYCGADLEALCTEALMCAMKRSISSEQSTAKSLMVHEDDFIAAKSKFVPAYLRSSISPACSLSEVICPLLQKRVESLMQQLEKNYSFKFVFPKQSFFPFITIVRNLLLFLCPYVLQNVDSNSFSASCACVSARIENNFQFIFYFWNNLHNYQKSTYTKCCKSAFSTTQMLLSTNYLQINITEVQESTVCKFNWEALVHKPCSRYIHMPPVHSLKTQLWVTQ
ncbi:ATPase family AAA domain-containing protein 2-like [Schistocerca piceifrons]|uniref:ATPase family AAA domain-containing protein 2-like n=1 Tax=Schistocerca piceifrons TaxID=274613 RepID=UPI001F5E9D01|nr:ATPase family AAA domain-containing protein 2-like [Schistocerca piceifrons]